MQTILERLNRLKLHHKWEWQEMATALGISYSLLNKIKANERPVSDQVAFNIARLELASGMKLSEDEPAMQLHKAAHPYTLGEVDTGDDQSELEVWKRRAKAAEAKLNELRMQLAGIVKNSDPAGPMPTARTSPPPSQTKPGRGGEIESHGTKRTGEDMLHDQSPEGDSKKKGKP